MTTTGIPIPSPIANPGLLLAALIIPSIIPPSSVLFFGGLVLFPLLFPPLSKIVLKGSSHSL
jgi:hypothetical protein